MGEASASTTSLIFTTVPTELLLLALILMIRYCVCDDGKRTCTDICARISPALFPVVLLHKEDGKIYKLLPSWDLSPPPPRLGMGSEGCSMFDTVSLSWLLNRILIKGFFVAIKKTRLKPDHHHHRM